MTDVSFDRLRDVALRDAWKHEALAFTPWLAQNIDHIAEAVGRQLELTGTEVPVGAFSADILARNLQDDSLVLIENQLEQTDHTHLGQIMTYLAGLEAKTVIWIAPSFREPHLSAIRWLNQHTADGFAFFALRLRVVRIGDSPYAPIFEVVEKPNGWDRVLQETARQATSEDSALREAFWAAYAEWYPAVLTAGLKHGWRDWVVRLPLIEGELRLTLFIGKKACGLYLQPPDGVPEAVAAAAIAARLGGAVATVGGKFLRDQVDLGYAEPDSWPAIADWLESRRRDLTDRFARPQGSPQ